ncbi:hypothetical protein Sjap_015525 [Stephania japonica]|uniref:Uncharacterized protein n=1 Tax=Stephania japonica TaxID=461633 RepID=A0AAP0IJF3_9MAGN
MNVGGFQSKWLKDRIDSNLAIKELERILLFWGNLLEHLASQERVHVSASPEIPNGDCVRYSIQDR